MIVSKNTIELELPENEFIVSYGHEMIHDISKRRPVSGSDNWVGRRWKLYINAHFSGCITNKNLINTLLGATPFDIKIGNKKIKNAICHNITIQVSSDDVASIDFDVICGDVENSTAPSSKTFDDLFSFAEAEFKRGSTILQFDNIEINYTRSVTPIFERYEFLFEYMKVDTYIADYWTKKFTVTISNVNWDELFYWELASNYSLKLTDSTNSSRTIIFNMTNCSVLNNAFELDEYGEQTIEFEASDIVVS
jgi:hypothetical protein